MSKLEIVNLEGKDHPALQSTYFRGSDVAPYINDDGKLVIVNGEGYRASWGSSNVKSIVTELTDTVTMVDVTGCHRHTSYPSHQILLCELDMGVDDRRAPGNTDVQKS